MERSPSTTVPRGRHAPPLEVRLGLQRTGLLEPVIERLIFGVLSQAPR